MNIKILGSCDCSCNPLAKTAQEAVNELGLTADIEKIKDTVQMLQYGVMSSPALVINEKVKASGRMLSKEEIKKYIQEENKDC